MATSADNMIEEILIALEDGAELVVSATVDSCISLYATTKRYVGLIDTDSSSFSVQRFSWLVNYCCRY